jgi:hypothetical protein
VRVHLSPGKGCHIEAVGSREQIADLCRRVLVLVYPAPAASPPAKREPGKASARAIPKGMARPCPECGKPQKGALGLGIHRAKTHGIRGGSAAPAPSPSKSARERTESPGSTGGGAAGARGMPAATPSVSKRADRPPPPPAPTVERGGVVTLSDPEAIRDLVARHFKGQLSRPIAELLRTTQPVVVATLHRVYELMDEQFSPVGPPSPLARSHWEDQMTDQARRAIAQRIAEGR